MARKRIVRMGKVYWYDDEKPVAEKIEDVKVSAKIERADGSEKELEFDLIKETVFEEPIIDEPVIEDEPEDEPVVESKKKTKRNKKNLDI